MRPLRRGKQQKNKNKETTNNNEATKEKTHNISSNDDKQKSTISYRWIFLPMIVFSVVQISLLLTTSGGLTNNGATTTNTNSITKDSENSPVLANWRKVRELSNSNSNTNNNNDNSNNNNNNNPQYETLWLITCETRTGREALTFHTWRYFATAVQKRQERLLLQQQQNSSSSSSSSSSNNNQHGPTVKVRNVCEGKEWNGFMTKFEQVTAFLEDLVVGVSNESNATSSDSDIKNKQHLVLFSDSDSIFNVFGLTIAEVVERYHVARQNMPILMSAEPNCWHGAFCNQKLLDDIYPEGSKDRSNCPRYLNSGIYMGDAVSLRNMLRDILAIDNNNDTTTTTDNTNQQESSSSPLLEKMKSLRMNPKDDQGRMMAWYAIYGKGKLAALDRRTLLLRNMAYGWIDATAVGMFVCGPRTEKGRGCGIFQANETFPGKYRGAMDQNTSAMVFDPVPGCSPAMTFATAKETNYIVPSKKNDNDNNNNNDITIYTPMYYETLPFVLHNAGQTGLFNKWVARDVQERIKQYKLTE